MRQGLAILIAIVGLFAFIAGYECGIERGKQSVYKELYDSVQRAMLIDPDDPKNPLNHL